jgi:hypothetical protein
VKRRRLALAAIAVAGIAVVAVIAISAALLLWPVVPPPPPLAEGERLRYAVSFMGVEAGTLDLVAVGEEASDDDCFIVEMRITSTNKLLERVFKIREKWRSRVDRDGIFSLGYELSRLHGSRELADEQSNDYAAGTSSWRRVKRDREWKGVVPLTGPVQDPVSWVYYCRERLARGERELRFVIVERHRVRKAELVIVGEEEVDLGPLGHVRALRTSGSVGLGGLGGEEAKDAEDAKEQKVDQAASVIWFDAATGVLLKARIAAKVGAMELDLREIREAPEVEKGRD